MMASGVVKTLLGYYPKRSDAFDDGIDRKGIEIWAASFNSSLRINKALARLDADPAQLGVVLAEVDTLEEGDVGILAAVRAIPSGGDGEVEEKAIVNELIAKLPPAVLDLFAARFAS